ncbi:hypothetical protein WJX77_012224 [Trebouxia sp. C0004]
MPPAHDSISQNNAGDSRSIPASTVALRSVRRSTADSARHGWDSRTKVAAAASASDTRGGFNKSSHAFSRASSDAGSVLDSISSTPRDRAPTRLQQHHTLQAVASRLQHAHSSELPQSQRSHLRNPFGAAPSVYDDCSDTASWTDEHFDWRQHAADLAQRQLESKQTLGQLAGSLKSLEDKLHEAMAQQSHFHTAHTSMYKHHARSGRHSNASSISEGQLIPAGLQSVSRTSSASLEDTDFEQSRDAEQAALARTTAHIAKWVQQSGSISIQQQHQNVMQDSLPEDIQCVLNPEANHQEAASQEAHEHAADQLVSCQLCHMEATVSVNLHVNADQDGERPSRDERQQQAAQTRYAKWLVSVSIVEDACSQLTVRNHNPGPGAKSVSYAQLLLDCALQ